MQQSELIKDIGDSSEARTGLRMWRKLNSLQLVNTMKITDLPPKNWSRCYVRIREENLQKEAG